MAPSDSSGVYSLPDGYDAVTGETILASQHNPPLEDLAESMTLRLMASGAKPLTGPLKLADGSVSAPGLTFNNSTSTGLYKTGDGFGVSIGGTLVTEFTAGGIRTGARYLGELIPFTGTTPPSLTVLAYGQTLSRTTYAALWAFAQIEIAAGNVFYNNGNGSTTFGIGDLRGRVPAGKDNIGGGTAAGRLNLAYFGSNTTILGNVGGLETHTLTAAQIPTITSINAAQAITVTTVQKVVNGPNSGSATAGGSQVTAADPGSGGSLSLLASTGSNSISVSSNNTSGAPHPITQPTILTNYILFAGA